MSRILFVITEDWALFSHRLHLVRDAIDAGYSVCVATRISSLKSQLDDMGIETRDWPVRRKSMNFFNEIAIIFRLWNIIRSVKPDLVHAVAIKPVLYAGMILVFWRRIKLVGTLGGLGFVFSSSSLIARTIRVGVVVFLRLAFLGRGRVLILQNQDDANLLESLGALTQRNWELVRGAGVELDMFKPSKIPEGRVKVISPGRILKNKGVTDFITVAARVKAKRSNVDFILAGDVDEDNPVSAKQVEVEEWVKSGIIQHWPKCPHSKMPQIYKESSIICVLSHREGLPKVLLEGASSGRPLIAFDVEGCRDVVINGVTGFLVPNRDLELLEKALLDLIDDRNLCMKFGRNGRRIAKSRFGSDTINGQIFGIWCVQLDDKS